MATRSAIIEKTADGYRGIYCHFDGYVKDGVGDCLREHYMDAAKVSALIDLGALSILGNTPDESRAYYRDDSRRLEPLFIATGYSIKQVARQISHQYQYVFENGKWTVNGSILEPITPMKPPVQPDLSKSDRVAVYAGNSTNILGYYSPLLGGFELTVEAEMELNRLVAGSATPVAPTRAFGITITEG